ncbi:DUF5641 domain-containing protein [Trichonephila clavipes]|nr:DUF5641 domain-containing protein [Trichonephila clavipes]
MPENPEELISLTPSMFLISNKNTNIEDIEELDSNSLNKRIKYRSKLLKDLRQRFTNEYLSQLIQKHNEKESRDPQIGEVVLVGDDNKKRLFWALAKIIELIPGRDGKIRTVRLKTEHGKILRPIQRIYPLEIRSNENLQRGLEESFPPVSETLSPDEFSERINFKSCRIARGVLSNQMRKSGEANSPAPGVWSDGVQNKSSSRTRFDDYVLVDTDIAVWGALSDAEIVALDHNNTESDEDESEELIPVTLSEAKVSLNKLRNFSLENHVDADILQASFVLEKSIDKVRLNALKQEKITDVFDKKD